ncbi:MAG TPA: L,D-transpeptidase, partial [Thermoanaerobaculia bacterium]
PRRKRPRRPPAEARFDAAEANDAEKAPKLHPGQAGSMVLRAQVLLDRAHFSPGEIDGRFNENTRRAASAFQKGHGIRPAGALGPETWRLLNGDSAPAVVSYPISEEDAAGPFFDVPEDMMEKASLPALGYGSPLEEIAERFHASPPLLRRLNPGKALEQAGEEILVPNVERDPPGKAARVLVDASDHAVYAFDRRGRVLARYPASVGSEHDPLPVGRWKIRGRSIDPKFHYNPDLFWDAEAESDKATIAPGPNNPVGRVWIDLSKKHYGIHGSPEPAQIGKTQSHGCIRLTNWDALELARIVSPGTPAVLRR